MARTLNLREAADEYVAHRAANQRANTVAVNTRGMAVFMEALGPNAGRLLVKNLDTTHGAAFRKFIGAQGWQPNTINAHITTVRGFVDWLHGGQHLHPAVNPLWGIKLESNNVKGKDKKRRLNGEDFPALLEAAHGPNRNSDGTIARDDDGNIVWHGSPHERILCALGLYTFCRQSEIITMTVGDVHIDEEEPYIDVTVWKTDGVDEMPVCMELEAELRRWLKWYANDTAPIHGAMRDDWYLVPARQMPLIRGEGPGRCYVVYRDHGNCLPTKAVVKPERFVNKALARFGWPMRDSRGRAIPEGMHTLRRSGARALFNELKSQNFDGAMRHVMHMLHHSKQSTTEIYLGVDTDRNARNRLLSGKPMFAPKGGANVVPLRKDEAI